jgi:hypothetical protein
MQLALALALARYKALLPNSSMPHAANNSEIDLKPAFHPIQNPRERITFQPA